MIVIQLSRGGGTWLRTILSILQILSEKYRVGFAAS
jgi:hypothetical protein